MFSRTQASSCCQDPVILAQRIALPLFGQQDAAHIGVAGELDAEHIEHFALQPIGGQVHGHGGGWAVAVRDHGLHAHALVARKAVQDVNHIETLGAFGVIDRREIDQVVEIQFQLERVQDADDGVGFGDHEILAQIR